MGTQYSWADTREKAAEAWGGRYPDAELEAELLEVFRERPAFVVDAIRDVTNGYEAGRVKSPWLLLRKQVQRPESELVVTDEGERERALSRARQWMWTCGLYYEREEVVDELFGDRGKLREWPALEGEMVALWTELRPAGEALEVDVETRLVEWRETRERLAKPRPVEGEDWVGEEPPLSTGAALA